MANLVLSLKWAFRQGRLLYSLLKVVTTVGNTEDSHTKEYRLRKYGESVVLSKNKPLSEVLKPITGGFFVAAQPGINPDQGVRSAHF